MLTEIRGEVSLHSYCVIPDNTTAFWAFADDIPQLASCKDALLQSKINQVEVNTSTNTWTIHIDPVARLDMSALDCAAEYLRQHCGLNGVYFISAAIHEIPIPELSSRINSHWQNITQSVSTDHMVRRLLSQANKRYDHNGLIIETPSRLSAEILTDRMVCQSIEYYISSNLNCKYSVSVVYDETKDHATSNIQDLITPEYQEALEQYASTGSSDLKEKKGNAVIFGRNIKGDPQSIQSITDEAKNVILSGELVAFELRSLRSGRFLLTFDLSDMTDGISGKVFF
jgi:DNA polymerase-3 subunit alpha (Gram-positive type)